MQLHGSNGACPVWSAVQARACWGEYDSLSATALDSDALQAGSWQSRQQLEDKVCLFEGKLHICATLG